ncbi:MAG: diaminopimelate decarboxylase family protein [Promethearchaeota archaeon]
MKKISGNPFLKKETGKVSIDSVDLSEITQQYKTPIMIFLENRIRENIRIFNVVFNSEFENFECFYSFKANFLPEICQIIHSERIGAEIVGLPELKLALKIGFPPEKIMIGGPYLTEKLIELSIKYQVKEIIIYDINDLKKVNDIAKRFNHIQDICIRVNSQKFASKLGVIFDNKNIIALKKAILDYKYIKIKSILSHYSTQMNDIKQYRENANVIASNLKNLREHGIKIDNINFGGGFPEATVMHQNQLINIAKEIKKVLEKYGIIYETIYFEPGRYFVGDAGLFIAKVVRVSENRWVFLDIGNHICPKFARCSLRFYNASKVSEPHKFKTSIAGIIPTDLDVLAKDYFFNETVTEGDLVIVTNTGAYCLTFSNRFPYILPKILLINVDNIKIIFDPEQDKDFSIN